MHRPRFPPRRSHTKQPVLLEWGPVLSLRGLYEVVDYSDSMCTLVVLSNRDKGELASACTVSRVSTPVTDDLDASPRLRELVKDEIECQTLDRFAPNLTSACIEATWRIIRVTNAGLNMTLEMFQVSRQRYSQHHSQSVARSPYYVDAY